LHLFAAMNNWLRNYPLLILLAIFFQNNLPSIVYISLYGNQILVSEDAFPLLNTYHSNCLHGHIVYPMGDDTTPPFAPYLMTLTLWCSCSPTFIILITSICLVTSCCLDELAHIDSISFVSFADLLLFCFHPLNLVTVSNAMSHLSSTSSEQKRKEIEMESG
jgi:hypothetical protein